MQIYSFNHHSVAEKPLLEITADHNLIEWSSASNQYIIYSPIRTKHSMCPGPWISWCSSKNDPYCFHHKNANPSITQLMCRFFESFFWLLESIIKSLKANIEFYSEFRRWRKWGAVSIAVDLHTYLWIIIKY